MKPEGSGCKSAALLLFPRQAPDSCRRDVACYVFAGGGKTLQATSLRERSIQICCRLSLRNLGLPSQSDIYCQPNSSAGNLGEFMSETKP
jgi:hypothetical protein